MAVGRLPRDQRNIGGTTTAPRTRRTQPAPSPRRTQYTSARWEATLREPLGAFPQAPRMYVVDVVGNTDLHGTPIDLRLEPRHGPPTAWQPAAWTTVDGNRGTCTTHIANPPKGRCTVVVRPNTAGQTPTLHAGRIVVQ